MSVGQARAHVLWLVLLAVCVACSGGTAGRPSAGAGVSSTIAPSTSMISPPTTATSTVDVYGGYGTSEGFCAQAPLSGSARYVVTDGRAVLKLSVSGLPPDASVFVNWVNDDQSARGYVVAGFTADASGLSQPGSVLLYRPGEIRGRQLLLSRADGSTGPLGVLDPCDTASPAGVQVVDLSWVSADHGWALILRTACPASPCTEVETTVNGGVTWSTIAVPDVCASALGRCPPGVPAANQIRFATPDIGYLFGPDLFLTTDGGRTWVPQPGRQVADLEAAGTDAVRISYTMPGCPVCDWGIEQSEVGTNDWRVLPSPPVTSGVASQLVRQGRSDVYASFLGNPAGGATAHAQVLVSHDDGTTWSSRSDPCGSTGDTENDLIKLAAAPDTVVVALCQPRFDPVGANDFVVISTDGARSFGARQLLPATMSASSIAITSSHDLVVSVEGVSGSGPVTYLLAVSHDAGTTWTTAVTDTQLVDGLQTARGFLGFETDTTGRWVGYPGTIWTTTDAGETWMARPAA